MCTQKGTPLRKPDGGIRPIGILNILSRIASALIAVLHREQMSLLLNVNDLGQGVKGGVEAAVHISRFLLHADANSFLIHIDVKNAFPTLSRAQIFSILRDDPDIIPHILTHYSIDSSVVYTNRKDGLDIIIENLTGIIQGDPLSGWIYDICWAKCLHSIRLAWPRFQIFTIHDDTYLYSNDLDHAQEVFNSIQCSAKDNFNLELQPLKSEWFAACWLTHHIKNAEHNNELEELSIMKQRQETIAGNIGCKFVSSGGLIVAGSPVGTSEFEFDFINSRVLEAQEILKDILSITSAVIIPPTLHINSLRPAPKLQPCFALMRKVLPHND